MRIEQSLGKAPQSDNKELEALLEQLRRVDNELVELTELERKVERNKIYKERKEALLKSLKEDIEELTKKLENLKTQMEAMLVHIDGSESERESKDSKIIEQEAIFKQLGAEIRDLKAKIQELEGLSIEGFTDAEILDLREILDKINKEIEALKNKQRKEDEYHALRKNQLIEKEKYIEELRQKLAELGHDDPISPVTPNNVHIDVVDDLDRMMLEYIKKWKCNVPITRMGKGYYLFGTRKIYAKILNGKLVIRVGGGYMIITEFLDQYSEVELNKIERLMEREGATRYEDIVIVKSHLQPVWDEKERSLKRRQKSPGKNASFKK